MDAVHPQRSLPNIPGGQPAVSDNVTLDVADVAAPVRTVAGAARLVLAVLLREGVLVAVTALLVLFLLPAALGAAGPMVVGG